MRWYQRRVFTDLRPSAVRTMMILIGLGVALVAIMGYVVIGELIAQVGHP